MPFGDLRGYKFKDHPTRGVVAIAPRRKRRGGRRTEKVWTKAGMGISRQLGFSDTQKVKLKYSISISFTSTSFQNKVFRMNSLFDPEFIIGGHQPMGYDQWTPMYNRYLVTGMAYDISYVNNIVGGGASNSTNIYAQFLPNATSPEVLEQSLRERPFVKRGILAPLGHSRRMKGYAAVKTILGLKHIDQRDTQYAGTVTTDPPITAGFYVYSSSSPAGVAHNCTAKIDLTYYAIFFDRKTPAGS